LFTFIVKRIILPRRRITDYLFYRRKKSRPARMIREIDIPCPIHQGQQCGISFRSAPEIEDELHRPIRVPAMCRCNQSPEDLYASVYSYISCHYRLRDYGRSPRILTVQESRMKLYSQWYRDYYTPKSSIPLGQISQHTNPLTYSDVQLAEFVPKVAGLADDLVQGYRGNNFYSATSMLNVREGGICSMQKMAYNRISIKSILTEKIETGRGEFPQFYYSTNKTEFPHLRLETLLREFSFDTTSRVGFSKIRHLVTPALRDLEAALGTDQYIGKFKLKYSPVNLIEGMKLGTSGGIANIDAITTKIGDVTFRICNSGKKIFLMHAAIKEVHHIMVSLANDKAYVFQPYNVTKLKAEHKYLFEKALASIPEALNKVREFFIPSLSLTLISELIHKYRMLIERGDLITIGVTPWYGGWYQLAVALNFDNPDIFWADGDVKSLDKHITDWQLYLYLSAGARYYDWQGMNPSQRTFLKRLYLLLQYHVVNKITLQPGTFWRLIRGVMYSGGKETSHGDSWIMALIFFLFIEHIRYTHPSDAPFIKQCLMMRFIAIIIYGDDHVWCCPKSLRHIINVKAFARFLQEFLGMELRDFKEYDSFLSRVSHATGLMTYRGPKFLKRYWIPATDFNIPNSAPVLPYKFYLEPLVRACTVTEEEGVFGYILKLIGQAWDTLGTNDLMYHVLENLYAQACTMTDKTPRELFLEWRTDPGKFKFMQSLAKKSTMRMEDFFESFPTLRELQSRHAYIPELCNNRPSVYVLEDYYTK
jgi:hypothetical protein